MPASPVSSPSEADMQYLLDYLRRKNEQFQGWALAWRAASPGGGVTHSEQMARALPWLLSQLAALPALLAARRDGERMDRLERLPRAVLMRVCHALGEMSPNYDGTLRSLVDDVLEAERL